MAGAQKQGGSQADSTESSDDEQPKLTKKQLKELKRKEYEEKKKAEEKAKKEAEKTTEAPEAKKSEGIVKCIAISQLVLSTDTLSMALVIRVFLTPSALQQTLLSKPRSRRSKRAPVFHSRIASPPSKRCSLRRRQVVRISCSCQM